MAQEIMRVTIVMEYPVDPDLYPNSTTAAERVEVDRKNFEQDPDLLRGLIEDPEVDKSVRVSYFVLE
jgi:hypothetical protein